MTTLNFKAGIQALAAQQKPPVEFNADERGILEKAANITEILNASEEDLPTLKPMTVKYVQNMYDNAQKMHNDVQNMPKPSVVLPNALISMNVGGLTAMGLLVAHVSGVAFLQNSALVSMLPVLAMLPGAIAPIIPVVAITSILLGLVVAISLYVHHRYANQTEQKIEQKDEPSLLGSLRAKVSNLFSLNKESDPAKSEAENSKGYVV